MRLKDAVKQIGELSVNPSELDEAENFPDGDEDVADANQEEEPDAAANQEEPEQRVPGACLLSSMVPLQLVARLPNEHTVILYQNELCNSLVSGNKILHTK